MIKYEANYYITEESEKVEFSDCFNIIIFGDFKRGVYLLIFASVLL